VGMLTDRDLGGSSCRGRQRSKEHHRGRNYDWAIACYFEGQDIEEAERVMEKNQIRRLPVLDHDNRIVGISF
jgi:CBS domain-containing protein